jgi:hypothetical protein
MILSKQQQGALTRVLPYAVHALSSIPTALINQNAMALALLVVAEQEEEHEDEDVTNNDVANTGVTASNGTLCNANNSNDDTASVMTTASTASSRMVQRSTVDCRGHRIIQVCGYTSIGTFASIITVMTTATATATGTSVIAAATITCWLQLMLFSATAALVLILLQCSWRRHTSSLTVMLFLCCDCTSRASQAKGHELQEEEQAVLVTRQTVRLMRYYTYP